MDRRSLLQSCIVGALLTVAPVLSSASEDYHFERPRNGVFLRGTYLDENDLCLFFETPDGKSTDVTELSWDLVHDGQVITGASRRFIDSKHQYVIRHAKGHYYANIKQIPEDATLGEYHLMWTVRDPFTHKMSTLRQRFWVV